MNLLRLSAFGLLFLATRVTAQTKAHLHYTISMDTPGSHKFHLVFRCSGLTEPVLDFRMPGYYQLLDYAKNVSDFHAADDAGHELPWARTDKNTWRVAHATTGDLTITYDISATKSFVAFPWLDTTRGYIAPAGIFFYIDGHLDQPVTVEVVPFKDWKIATGLQATKEKPNIFLAPDFDMLYDCPILAGNLEELPSFTVRGIPHYFTGYQLGVGDKEQFSEDLKKIVEQGVAVIDDVPYKDYTFLAIGNGPGGIEHLNSTTIGFSGASIKTREARQRTLCFIAHEYFHHYNVKRIRPIALGPFDYQRANLTDQLWVSEGLTVYYEYLLVRRAGLMTGEELLHHFQSDIAAYENKSGHLYKSLAKASEETWSDGPFGGNADSSISYYQKGPAVGLLLDMAIRHYTKNKKSLDDVMKTLYQVYYQEEKRGFTGAEFRQVCETTAGAGLAEIFDYVYTVKEPDYAKYLAYGGLGIDQNFRLYPLPQVDALQAAIRRAYVE